MIIINFLQFFMSSLQPKSFSFFDTVSEVTARHEFYRNLFVYNFKPPHLASFWSLISWRNLARLSWKLDWSTHTGSNYEYDWRLWSKMHERSSIKSSVCHTESLFRLSLTHLLWLFLLQRNMLHQYILFFTHKH